MEVDGTRRVGARRSVSAGDQSVERVSATALTMHGPEDMSTDRQQRVRERRDETL
jgi:hypothetical protein